MCVAKGYLYDIMDELPTKIIQVCICNTSGEVL